MGEVTVACVPSTVYYYLSQVIRRYRETYPRCACKVLDAGANEVLAAVSRGEADFGLNFIGSQEPDIDFQPLAEERFVAACRRDHPLARKRRTTWAELAAYDFIAVSKSSGNRLLLDQALAGVPAAAFADLRGAARDHAARPGRGRPGRGGRALAGDAGQGPPAAGQRAAGRAGGQARTSG
jgi:DNA-binding transcriptional LysR family regulator